MKKFKSLFKKHNNIPQQQQQILIEINDKHGQIVCNIDEFIEWCRNVEVLDKKTTKQLETYSSFFIAYHSYITLHNLEDTPDYRKLWYRKQKGAIIVKSIANIGM